MDLSTFVTEVYCLIDEWLATQPRRRRGFAPALSDSEVLMMEVV